MLAIIFVNFYQNFFYGIEYHRIRRYSLPWKKFQSKLTQIIGQTLFFHFDEIKTIPWKFRQMGTVWNLMHEPSKYNPAWGIP